MNSFQRLAFAIVWFLVLSATSVFAQVHADFSADRTSSCSPLQVRFTDQSTGNITSWKWFLGNGNISTQKNPGAIYLTPGYKTVTLVVSDGVTSDTIVKTNYLRVFKNPEANFGVSAVTGCVPKKVCFTDSTILGDAPIVSWLWDFGDGHSSTAPAPCNTYLQAGSFTVTLVVRDQNGCESQKTFNNMVVIQPELKADFSSNVQSSCNPPLNVQFTRLTQSSLPLTYSWNFGNGAALSTAANPSANYTVTGVFNVSLVVANSIGCRDTLVKPGYIAVENLVANFTSNITRGCVGTAVKFSDASTSNPNSWAWDFGDGTIDSVKNPNHIYTAAGIYTVKLTSANPTCGNSVTKVGYITIVASPVANFGGSPLEACSAPLTVQFSDSSTNAISWLWNFGDSTTSALRNPSHTYTTLNSFDVTLTVMNADSCKHTLVKPRFVNLVAPKASIVADTTRGCSPLTVNFRSDSSTSTSQVVGWFWDFGDGQTSTLQNPTHVFQQNQVYDIKLTIYNADGCTDSLVRNSYIRAGSRPTGQFVASDTSFCLYAPVKFTDLSTTNANEWLWDFGDGGTSLDQNPTYSYGDTGYFDIRLIVGFNGCRDTIIKKRYIYVSPPDARFRITRNCATPYTINFVDNSLAPDTWYWSFGDGDSSTVQNPSHTFATRGTYAPTLTVEDTVTRCFDIETMSIKITDPEARFVADAVIGCRPFTTTFRDSSIDASSYSWKVGTLTSTQKNPTFTFNTPGIYDAQLIITDANGCKDTLLRPAYITVNGPTADFVGSPTVGCAPLRVAFTDSSKTFMSPITNWMWYFGDGDSSALQNPIHVYNTVGSFKVTLTVKDANGCSHSIARSNYIKPSFPNPAFKSDTVSCVGAPVIFTNTSVGTTLTYVWDFGDGFSSTAASPTHVYTQEGTYTIKLKAKDANGCDSTLVKNAYIKIKNPKANFSGDSTSVPCPPLLVNFTDLSTSDITVWEWHFGDGSTSNLKNPSHLYLHPGNFTVKLITTNAKGCKDTIVKADFVVVLGPSGVFTFTPSHACVDNNVLFTAVTTNTAIRTWDYGDGNVQTAGDTVLHSYRNYGVYYPVLILDDGLGCIFPVPTLDSVVVGFINPNFGANRTYVCRSGSVSFTDSTVSMPGIVSWKWFFGDGDSSSVKNPTHYYANPGLYDVTLITTNGHCIDTFVKQAFITVDEGPMPSFDLSVPTGCVPQAVNITNTTSSATTMATWAWTFGNGQTDSVKNPTAPVYTTPGTYQIQLIAVSMSACTDTFTRTIPIYSVPVVRVANDTAICYNDSTNLVASGALNYTWSPATGLNNANIANPIASPASTTTYVVLGTDTNGCQSTDTITLTINPLPLGDITDDLAICIGESVELDATGGDHYIWSPAATLDCDNCASVIATPMATTSYQVTITNQYLCTDVQQITVTVNPYPTGILSTGETICFGESVTLESVGGTSHIWGPAGTLDCDTCAIVTAKPNFTTTYSVLVTNQYNCTVDDTVLVTVNALPVIAITGRTEICRGEKMQLTATGGSTYSWSPAKGLSCTTCAAPMVTIDSTITYKLVVTTAAGCMDSTTHTITVNDLPTVSTISDITICAGDNVILTSMATLADHIAWSPAIGLSDASILSPVASPTQTTEYTVTIFSPHGCTATATVKVTVVNKVSVSLTGANEICYGENIQLNTEVLQAGHLGIHYVWNPVNFFSQQDIANPVLSPDSTRTYTLIAYSGSCVPDTQKLTVVVNQLPVLGEGKTVRVVEGSPVTLSVPLLSGTPTTYTWTPNYNINCNNCEKPTILANQSELYRLTIIDEHGCQATGQMMVEVLGRCGDDLFVPNTFTPNRDGKNDVLKIRGLAGNSLKIFRIFDRWGNMVYESDNIDEGWNGIYNGRPLDSGVFVYYYEAVCTNGFSVVRQGNVTLLK
ncbi:hypothetical protein BH09BAC1_BH09BAC1_01920 [soil metagenome]